MSSAEQCILKKTFTPVLLHLYFIRAMRNMAQYPSTHFV